jgi:hypothetical protein
MTVLARSGRVKVARGRNADAAASATAASVAAADLDADGRLVDDEVSEASR